MGLGEADTGAKLIDPAIHARGWTEDLIRREETAGAIEIVEGRPRKGAKGRVEYLLRIRVNPHVQPVAVASGHDPSSCHLGLFFPASWSPSWISPASLRLDRAL